MTEIDYKRLFARLSLTVSAATLPDQRAVMKSPEPELKKVRKALSKPNPSIKLAVVPKH